MKNTFIIFPALLDFSSILKSVSSSECVDGWCIEPSIQYLVLKIVLMHFRSADSSVITGSDIS